MISMEQKSEAGVHLAPEQIKRLRQLAHDMRSSLSVISMGVQLLEQSRNNPREFLELCEMMQTRGIESLTDQIDSLGEFYGRRPTA